MSPYLQNQEQEKLFSRGRTFPQQIDLRKIFYSNSYLKEKLYHSYKLYQQPIKIFLTRILNMFFLIIPPNNLFSYFTPKQLTKKNARTTQNIFAHNLFHGIYDYHKWYINFDYMFGYHQLFYEEALLFRWMLSFDISGFEDDKGGIVANVISVVSLATINHCLNGHDH